MLDDNLLSNGIIEKRGAADEGLNAQNLANWPPGGYQRTY
jgi:hypothetical protein